MALQTTEKRFSSCQHPEHTELTWSLGTPISWFFMVFPWQNLKIPAEETLESLLLPIAFSQDLQAFNGGSLGL